MKQLAVAVALLAFCATSASGERDFDSGNAYQPGCRIVLSEETPSDRMEAAQAMRCLTSVTVVLKMGPLLDQKSRFCEPSGATIMQGLRVVMKFMDDHPADTHQDFIDLSIRALKAAWRCSNPK